MERLTRNGLERVIRGAPSRHFSYTLALGDTPAGTLLYRDRNSVHLLGVRGNSFSGPLYPGVRNPVLHMLLDHLGQQWLATYKGLLLLTGKDPLATGRLITSALVSCLLETTPGKSGPGRRRA